MMRIFLAATICLCSTLLPTTRVGAATFSFSPSTTFEVGDGFSEPFDGQGDTDSVFPGNFDTVVLGTFGENSENAEFDLSGFSIPREETIARATFQVTVLPNETSGLGAPGQRPSSLVVRGYIGNGQPDAEDFQAGTILDTADVSPELVEELITFDVTSFIQNTVREQNDFAGFGVRAEAPGGLLLDRGTFSGNSPTLTITTASVRATVPEPSSTIGILACIFLGRVILGKRQ